MTYRLLRCGLAATLACGLSATASAGDLKLSMQGGRVTLIADNVPLRQILQEWARVGQTKIINAEKLNGPVISLQLINATERDALDILLRSASGYIAAPRPVPLADAAFYDRVTIMATSHAPAATAGNMPPPTFQRPPMPIEDTDEPINVAMPPPPQGNPVTGQYLMQPQPGQGNPVPGQYLMPPQPGMVAPMVQPPATAPLTSPRPGAVQQPQSPLGLPNPYQPIAILPGTITRRTSPSSTRCGGI